MTYRDYDGLKRGKKGGISGHNTTEDWANYYRRGREQAKKNREEAYRQSLITERIEPKKYSSYLIEPKPPKNYRGEGAKATLFYDKQKKSLYFTSGYGKFHPKIGCPIIMTLEDELEYCCEITNYNDNELEVLICVNNEKRIFPVNYGPPFLGIWKSNLACFSCTIPFQLFDENI